MMLRMRGARTGTADPAGVATCTPRMQTPSTAEPPRILLVLLVDLVYQCLLDAKDNGLTPTKARIYLQIMMSTHEHSLATLASREQCFHYFADTMVSTNETLDEGSQFSVVEVKGLTECACQSYINFVKLHQFAFTSV